MDFSRKDFVTHNEILSDVLRSVRDERYLFETPGWYISQMQQCLEELSFDSLFDEKTQAFDLPENLNLPMPEGCFNIIEIFLFRGDDLCSIESSANVWHKRNFFKKGTGYLARNKPGSRDPFYGHCFNINRKSEGEGRGGNFRRIGNENTYYYNIENGVIMFSDACKSFPKVAIKYNGTGCPIGDAPVIPLFFRQAVKDWTCEIALRNRIIDNPQIKSTWQIYDRNLNLHENFGMYKGSYYKAKRRIADMGSHERECLKEYLAKPSW